MSAQDRNAEEEGIPPFDEDPPNRPSDDDQEVALPADRPVISQDHVTVTEQRMGDSVRTRLAREVPDAGVDDVPTGGEVAARLVEETQDGRDVTPELEATETGDDAGLSAEEAAVTVREGTQPDEPSSDEVAGRGADRGA